MEDFWFRYWWLIFPIGFFIFGAWDRWLSYQRSRDTIELIKTYTAQGKEPPPELLRGAQGDYPPPPPEGFYGDRYARRAWRRYYRWGPDRNWRVAISVGAVAAGFWIGSEMGYLPDASGAFRFVAVILTCIAAGNLALALVGTMFRRGPDRD